MTDTVLAQLDRLAVDYEVVDCDPTLADTAEFCAAYGYSAADSANAIVVVGKADPRRYAACVVLADSRLDVNGTVRKRFGTRKASFADAAVTEELTGMVIGGVTPLGLPDDLPIWVDARVLDRDRIVLGGGTRDRKIVTAPSLFEQLPGVEIVEALAKVAG